MQKYFLYNKYMMQENQYNFRFLWHHKKSCSSGDKEVQEIVAATCMLTIGDRMK